MNKILLDLLYFILSVAITIGGAYAARYIKTKTDMKYKDEIAGAVFSATSYTQQTLVDEAKKNRAFDDEKQEQARRAALDMTYELLSASAKNYLYRGRSESQAKDYLLALIEESVRIIKKEDIST